MKGLTQTPEQIKEQYEIEKQLAERLRTSTRQERQTLYASLYDELFIRVPHHPQLVRKSSQDVRARIAYQLQLLQPFLSTSSTFLEIGPGDCALSLEMAKLVKQVYAVDISEEITKGLVFPANLYLILSDGIGIPAPANSIDVAFSNNLMEHLHPDDAVEQLRNIHQALAPGGVYICVTPNRLRGPHDVSKYFDTVATGFHLKEYTIAEASHLFRMTGFSRIRQYLLVRGIRIFSPTFPVKLGEILLGMLPYSLRKAVASSWPVAPILGITLIGTK